MLRRLALGLAALAVLASGPAHPVATVRLSDADAVTIGAPALVQGTAYTFESMLSGRPVRWNPCAPIHWRYRTAGQVTGGFTAVSKAVARMARVTGTTWVYDGASTTTPTTAWLPKTASSRPPVLIGWTTAAHSDLLQGQSPNVLGVTRMAWFGVTQNGVSTASIHSAVVALNQSKSLPLTGSVSWYTVALHELSHAMGLGHATASNQLMYPVIQRGLTDLQPGDVAGLQRLGRSQGCLSV